MPKLLVSVGAALLLGAAAPPTACRLKYAPAVAGVIGYRDCGAGDPIVIIPGGPGLDADYIVGLAEMVAGQGHRVILVEPRGTGASRRALGDGSQLTVAGSVADVEAVRRAASADHITILGHSFGGGVAQAYAAGHPDHVAHLVLMDSVGPDMSAPHGPLDSWRHRLTAADLKKYDAARKRGDRLAAMRIKFRGNFYHSARGKAFVGHLTDQAVHLDVAPLSVAYQRDFHIDGLRRDRFRVTFMAGEIDWSWGYESALRATYPGARLIVIPHAGHFPWIDAPAATRRLLKQVLAGDG
jgi:proline iminopeptidase